MAGAGGSARDHSGEPFARAAEAAAGAARMAEDAWPAWAAWPLQARARLFNRLRPLLVAEGTALAEAAAAARGCSRVEALASEVIPLADATAFLARRLPALLRPQVLDGSDRPLWVAGSRVVVHRDPYGVVLVIGPANYPLFLPGIHALQALAAGNAVLVKPAPGCGAMIGRLAVLLEAAGLPAGLLQVLGDGMADGRAAVAAGGIGKVVLTGSAATGRAVLGVLSERLIPATVELAGNDAVFVLPGADPLFVARALAYGLRLNGGRTCIAPRRVFVTAEAAPALEAALGTALATVPAAKLDPAALERCAAVLADARTRGAAILRGPANGAGFPAAAALGIGTEARLAREDVFGPILGVVRVADIGEALGLAAACPYRLGAAVFGPEPEAMAVAAWVDAGVVTVNDLIVPTADPRVPFGGRGASGYGTTRGAEGLLEMTRPRAVIVRGGRFRPHYDPERPDDEALLTGYLGFAHGRDLVGRVGSLWAMIRAATRTASDARRSKHSQ